MTDGHRSLRKNRTGRRKSGKLSGGVRQPGGMAGLTQVGQERAETERAPGRWAVGGSRSRNELQQSDAREK